MGQKHHSGTFAVFTYLQEGVPQHHDCGLIGLEAHGRRRKKSKICVHLRRSHKEER